MSKCSIIKTTCPVCGSGCLADACVENGKLVSLEGTKDSPSQSGRLCAKGLAAKQFVYHQDRVRYPLKRVGEKGEGKFQRISWDEAYDMAAENLLHIRREHGAKSTVFYAGHPKWFRPALLRLSNAYGSPNFCTESSTCFQAAQLAWRLNYGSAICGPDFAHTKTLLVWTSNLYHSNTNMADTYKQLKEKGVKIIVVDPRHTVTAHDADIHMQLKPGTDGALALAMAHVMIAQRLYDEAFVSEYVQGFPEYCAYVNRYSPEYTQGITGVPAQTIREAARLYAGNGPSSILFSASPIVHHINGVQNYRAVFALPAITGNYDVEGGNCPGAAAVSPYNEFGKIKRYDKEEALGEKQFPAWFALPCNEAQGAKLADYILDESPYPVKGLFAVGLNHRMWPQPSHLQLALKKLDFFVNVELFLSDSSNAADLVLPACTSLEREEVHTIKGRSFFYSGKAIEPEGESKNDIEIIMEVCRRMKLHEPVLGLGYQAYMQHIIEPSGLSLAELKESKSPLQGRYVTEPSYRSYEKAPFPTESGKIELRSLLLAKYENSHGYEPLPVYHDFRVETDVDRTSYPFILSTGCRKPQYFHARVNRLPWLSGLEKAPLLEMHPKDAEALGIAENTEVRIISPVGEIRGIAVYSINAKCGTVFIYHGNASGDANELIDKDYLDPISGFPGYKGYFCRVERWEG